MVSLFIYYLIENRPHIFAMSVPGRCISYILLLNLLQTMTVDTAQVFYHICRQESAFDLTMSSVFL